MEDRRPESKRAPDHLKRQSLKREYRFVTPAVRLERKNISMINPPPPGQQQQHQEQATYGPARDIGEDTARSSGETPGSGFAPEISGSTREGHRSITEASVSAPGPPSQSPGSTRETGRSSKEASRATQETMGSTTDSPGSTSDDAPRSTPRSTSIVGEKGPLEEDTGSSSLAALPPNGHRQHQEEEPLQQPPPPPPKEPQRPQELQQQPQVLIPLSMQPPVLSTAPVAACTRGSKEIPKIRTEDSEKESAETLHQELTETTEEEAFFLSKAAQELTTTKERSEEEGDSTTPQLQAQPLHPTERVDTRDELSRLAAAAATSRPIVQAAQRPPKQESAQVMEFFEQQDLSISSEHEHSLDEVSQSSLLVVPSGHHHHHHHHHGSLHHRGQRSPSPSSLHASVGLSHLDNLIRLMEQLSTLRDENLKLRKKCDYLETTKKLLQVRSEMHGAGGEAHSGEYTTLPPKHKHKAHHHHHHHHHHRHASATEYVGGKVARPRLASAEDIEYPEICESASDHRPKRPKGVMHKRSFSTGSLEVEILDETTTSHGREHLIPKSKSGKSVFSAKSPKQKSKSSKWARVKKVLTGQKLYEDLGTTIRSLKELGRSAQRYSTASTDFSPPTHRVTDHRSVDSGVSTSLDADSAAARLLRTSSSSAEASSAGRSPNHTGEGGGVEELGTEIWMGPPGWWEQYEARKHSEASNSSDVSSVIEVKTMYLGSKQKDSERLLKVKPLIRRQSSPSLITKDMEGDEDDEDDEGHQIHRSSSYKGEDLDLPVMVASSAGKEKDCKKLHQKAWGRVKEMIHVRKDSMKKRRREKQSEGSEWSQGEEISEVDMEGLLEEQLSAEFGEGIMSRSTPKTSPMVIPRQGAGSKSLSESPPRGQGLDPSSPSLRTMASSAGSADMAAMLAGSMSEEFTQKMLEWQALQLRKSSSFRITQQGEAEGEGSCVDGTTPGDRESQELLSTQSPDTERTGRARAVSLGTTKELENPTEGITSELTPLELIDPSVNVEDLQRRISESFSRKLAEWERRKYRRPTTPEMEPKGSRRKEKEEPRVRSKKTREDKERERQEKLREREIQKVEKEQVKLEKEKVRIEKERIRAMERQAKLERMKGRLSQLDSDSAPPPSSPALTSTAGHTQDPRDPKVAAQFQRKLEELEAMKDAGVAAHVDVAGASPQPSSFQPQFTIGPASGQQRPPPLTLEPCAESPEERSPVDRTSDISLGDDSTSITEENLTKTNIASLERANNQLLVEVQKKEQEYGALQDEVNKLNSQLAKVRQEHASEMARFKRELEAGEVSGPVQVDVSDLEQTMRELEERIVMMENAGDQLAESMESAAIGKWQSIEGEEAVSGQLVDMVEQMKSMLVQASHSRESSTTSVSSAAAAAPPPPPPTTTAVTGQEKQSEKSMALHNFEQVYSHAMKLQVQMNNLRVSQLERNKEIMLIKRQLLLQEVNNVLLQAHITRRESELYQYREAKKHANVRRWNTFTSSDTTGRLPLASSQGDTRPPLLRNSSLQENEQAQAPRAKHGGKHDDIPYITEDVSIPEAGVAAEPGVKKKGASSIATTTPAATTSTTAIPATTSTTAIPAKRPEQSTDHLEQHMASPIADTTKTEEQKTGVATTATVATGPSLAVQAPKSSAKTPAADTAKHKTSAPVASKVETGSPTLLTQTTANGSATVPADGAGPTRTTKTETPDTPIPKGPLAGTEPSPQPAASAQPIDDTYSPTESVIVTECTKSAVDRDTGEPQGPDTGSDVATGGVDISSREQAQPKAVRSPVSKQKYLRRQKEEREKHNEKKLASPKSPHRDVASGKPPLPRQSTPHSPNTAQRSKSVGDMDGIEPNGATAEQPLKDVIERFEKRATVCETEERKIEFRKTPSPTLHLPRVGLVSRVRRLKPAAELLEESQRYRSGHSIYATRIMNRYLPAQPRSGTGTPTSSTPAASSQDKENISETSYVQAIVKRLSRENTPVKSTGSSSTNSSLSLHRTDSPHAHSEFVAHLVHKLSSSSGPESHKPSSSHSPSMPLKDLTNDGQVKKLAQVFSEEPRPSPDQPEIEPDSGAPGQPGVVGGSPSRQHGMSGASAQPDVQPDSTISPASHASMPALASQQAAPEDSARGRAATYCTSEADRPHQQQRTGADNGGSIEQLSSEDLLDPSLLEVEGNKISPSSSTKSKNVLCCQSSACNRDKSNNHKSQTPGSKDSPASPKSQERRGGHGGRGDRSERMETIGVLCKQSMSFDLGVSLRAQSPELAFRGAAAVGAEPSAAVLERAKVRPSSTSSEGDTTSSEDKKKSRSRFLDSSWLQKPKKFFKVSK